MTAPAWFDGKMSLGNIITVITVIFGLAAGWFSFDTRLTLAEDRFARQVQADKEAMATARQRLDRIDADREDLRTRIIRIESLLSHQDTKLDAILRNTSRQMP